MRCWCGITLLISECMDRMFQDMTVYPKEGTQMSCWIPSPPIRRYCHNTECRHEHISISKQIIVLGLIGNWMNWVFLFNHHVGMFPCFLNTKLLKHMNNYNSLKLYQDGYRCWDNVTCLILNLCFKAIQDETTHLLNMESNTVGIVKKLIHKSLISIAESQFHRTVKIQGAESV